MGRKRRLLAAQMDAIEAWVDAEVSYERDGSDENFLRCDDARRGVIEAMGAQRWEMRQLRKAEKAERRADREDFAAMMARLAGHASLESF